MMVVMVPSHPIVYILFSFLLSLPLPLSPLLTLPGCIAASLPAFGLLHLAFFSHLLPLSRATCFAMPRASIPSPHSARALLFGDGPKVGDPYSFVPAKPLPLPFFLVARTGGRLQDCRQAVEDSQALARLFRGRRRALDITKSLRAARRQVCNDEVSAPSPPPPNPPPPPPPPPHRAGILKHAGSTRRSGVRHVSFGDVTVHEIENCLVPRPFPPPAHALFPRPGTVKTRSPVGPPPLPRQCHPVVEAQRQSHRKHSIECTSRHPSWGTVIGVAAACIGFSALMATWSLC